MSQIDVCHVLHLSQRANSNPISGAERHVLTLLTGLAARGTRAELIALIWHDGSLVRSHLAELEAHGVRVTRIHKLPASAFAGRVVTALWAWARLWALLRTRRQAIVHLHLELVAPAIAIWLARCRRVVITIHNDEPHYRTLRWRVWLALLNVVVRRYIAISGRVASYFAEAARTSDHAVRTVMYGLDAPAQVAIPRERLQVPRDVFLVGFVGRLVPQKDPELLVRAAAGLPGCHVVIIGAGPLAPHLEAVASSMGASNVTLAGAIPDAGALISAFDVLCVPSRWEGFGLNVLEAMLARVPVVATATGALPELLDGGGCGVLVTPGSSGELRDALESLRVDPARRRQLAARAHERAISRYTVGRMVDETLNVYADVRLAG